ncbi:hypothetical protein GCM10022226_49230 [Sphaerisporangium flaviroseum]|uniref:Pyrroloquinoline quinone biosynthesis peptide chaperone PqqD n=1 Tax=Sphaerisporangium flaviroseum TaxID=509199 RepID=A0ABP7INI0_9ACTN
MTGPAATDPLKAAAGGPDGVCARDTGVAGLVDPGWRPVPASSILLRHDAVRDADLLVMPERVVVLNGEAAHVVRLCDGSRTVTQIVGELSAAFPDAPVADDVPEFLRRVREEGWLR